MFRSMLLLSLALLSRSAAAQVEVPSPQPKAGTAEVDTSSLWVGFWLSGGIGLTGIGPGYQAAANVLYQRWVLTLGLSNTTDRGLHMVDLTGEWESLQDYHLMVNYLITPPTQRTQLCLGVGGGVVKHQEHLMSHESVPLFGPVTYLDRTRTAFNVPVRFHAQFFANAPLGLYLALEAHLNNERTAAGLYAGVRLLPITR